MCTIGASFGEQERRLFSFGCLAVWLHLARERKPLLSFFSLFCWVVTTVVVIVVIEESSSGCSPSS